MRITNVSPALYTLASNIASNKGISINKLLRPLVRDIAREAEEINLKGNNGRGKEIILRGDPLEIEEVIKDLAGRINVSYSDLLKIKLLEKLNTFPEQFKKTPLKY